MPYFPWPITIRGEVFLQSGLKKSKVAKIIFKSAIMASEKKLSILLVEDEVNLHEALKLNLELEGYEVSSAFNGEQALKIIQQEYFDLIILDVMLPGIDGISITET